MVIIIIVHHQLIIQVTQTLIIIVIDIILINAIIILIIISHHLMIQVTQCVCSVNCYVMMLRDKLSFGSNSGSLSQQPQPVSKSISETCTKMSCDTVGRVHTTVTQPGCRG